MHHWYHISFSFPQHRLPPVLKAATLLNPLLINSPPITKKNVFLTTAHQLSTFPQNLPLDFAVALTFSSRTNNHSLGSKIHAQTIKFGFSNDIFTSNNLLWMYSTCQILELAFNLFDEMPKKNLVSWTSMISGCVRNNEHEMSLLIYLEMIRSGFKPNEFTLSSVLSASTVLHVSKLGCCFHSVSFKIGIERNSFVGSSLLCMYAKCGNIESAELVFGCINHQDMACLNSMVEGYASNGYSYEAMGIVCMMHSKGFLADQFTFISALKGCSIAQNASFGQQLHSLIIYFAVESSNAVMNSLMEMYFRNEMSETAMEVFSRIGQKDIVSWNTVICSYAEEDNKEVVALFSRMISTGLKPNQVTFSAIFRHCGATENLSLGLQFCCFAYQSGFFCDALIVNAVINLFSKCGLMAEAYQMFSFHSKKNIVTYNEMIAGCNHNGYTTKALQLFSSLMKYEFEPDEFTYSTVLNACDGIQRQKIGEQIHAIIIKSGFCSYSYVCTSLINAYERFESVRNSFKIFQDVRVHNLASWGAIISAFGRKNFNYEAFSLLNSLREAGACPDEFILGSILNACANIAVLNQCICVHSLVIKTCYERNLHVASAAIDAYAKCGDINSAKMFFDVVARENDSILFNTMITAFAHHGMIAEVIEVFERMRRNHIPPTQATFVAVISACSHLGKVEEGQFFFDSISSITGMKPSKDNYGCLVDLLARNGLLEKAKDVVKIMPYEPWPAVWRSLLSGCRIHGDKEIANLASEKLLQLQRCHDGALVLLSNCYAENGRWEDVANLRMRIAEKGIQIVPGYSIV